MTASTPARTRPSIVIAGGGLVGLTTAWHLQRTLGADDAAVTVINPTGHMVYQSLLPEVASGMLEPTDVVVPLRRVLDRTHIVAGRIAGGEPPAGSAGHTSASTPCGRSPTSRPSPMR